MFKAWTPQSISVAFRTQQESRDKCSDRPPDYRRVKRGGPGKYILSSCVKRRVVPYLVYYSTLKAGPIYFSKTCLTFTVPHTLHGDCCVNQQQQWSQCLIPAFEIFHTLHVNCIAVLSVCIIEFDNSAFRHSFHKAVELQCLIFRCWCVLNTWFPMMRCNTLSSSKQLFFYFGCRNLVLWSYLLKVGLCDLRAVCTSVNPPH